MFHEKHMTENKDLVIMCYINKFCKHLIALIHIPLGARQNIDRQNADTTKQRRDKTSKKTLTSFFVFHDSKTCL